MVEEGIRVTRAGTGPCRNILNNLLKKSSVAGKFVIPVQTGIQERLETLDSRLRGMMERETEIVFNGLLKIYRSPSKNFLNSSRSSVILHLGMDLRKDLP